MALPRQKIEMKELCKNYAKAHKLALNDCLLRRLAFQVMKIAIFDDIAEMFYRIIIREENMHALRILWYENCVPFKAHIVRDKNAEAQPELFPLASSTSPLEKNLSAST